MKKKINWSVYVDLERNKAIELIKSTISRNDGHIIKSNFFSDLALSLTVEIEERNIAKLYAEFASQMKISDFEGPDSDSSKEWWLLLNISFVKGTGDLRNEIPDVPG